MGLFERGPKAESGPEKESEPMIYALVDVNRSNLIGLFENFEEVSGSDKLFVGDLLFKITKEDSETIKRMEDEGRGEEIKGFLREKGYKSSSVPAQKDRR